MPQYTPMEKVASSRHETFISKTPKKLVRTEIKKKEQALDKLKTLEEKINKLVK